MQIRSIELTNFRSFAGAVVDLSTRVTFLIAKNHAGKSSVIDALGLTLTGHCRGTSADGKGADVLIRDGASAMKIAVKVLVDDQGPFTVERMQNARTSTLAIGGIVGTRGDAIDQLAERFGCSPAVIDACLNTEAFLDLHHASAKDVLLEVLDVRVPINGTPHTIKQLDAAYDHWYRERPVRKRAFEAVKLPPAPEEGTIPDVAELTARLAARREEEKALIAQTSEEAGRRVELDRQLVSLRKDEARLSDRLTLLAIAKARNGATVDLQEAIDEITEQLATTVLTPEEAETGRPGAHQSRVSRRQAADARPRPSSK
jgi:hypothetical protein